MSTVPKRCWSTTQGWCPVIFHQPMPINSYQSRRYFQWIMKLAGTAYNLNAINAPLSASSNTKAQKTILAIKVSSTGIQMNMTLQSLPNTNRNTCYTSQLVGEMRSNERRNKWYQHLHSHCRKLRSQSPLFQTLQSEKQGSQFAQDFRHNHISWWTTINKTRITTKSTRGTSITS